jgi:tetratricopeptide (TPR) repeat protein
MSLLARRLLLTILIVSGVCAACLRTIHALEDQRADEVSARKAYAYIEWEKYEEARKPLEKALALHPDDARALYYLALVERRQRHSEAEVADLEKVVAQFPNSRDARRELGISYYQLHRSNEAQQFKALQAIDPDNLAAHYNLAILYRRIGMKQQAAQEAALYTMSELIRQRPPIRSTTFVNIQKSQPKVCRGICTQIPCISLPAAARVNNKT